ncbi:MAG: pyrroline-5-carboxylate reductase [Rhodospirillales bacterium]|nr:pyrroline-5-carboxylate reductase [Rhodospirillales bacterium]MCB9995434.1 pyrroline-5-carboxylate reductase [Rhodospirillales bacterium]
MTKNLNIALIGCGKMGSAMLRGWLSAKIEDRVTVLDPVGLPEEFAAYAPNPVTHYSDAARFSEKAGKADVYVMAVKPQIMDEVCKTIAPAIPGDALILSIAAGQTIGAFESRFGADKAIIRAMPNTPAAIGKGISVAVGNTPVTDTHKDMADTLLQSVGQVEWVDREDLLDPVTAVSGSGPAYVFLLIETLAKAGENAGLDADFAMKLARQTVIGSAALAEQESTLPASKLRENVTSPGGTTAAALDILMDGKWQDIMTAAIAAATKRSKELSS